MLGEAFLQISTGWSGVFSRARSFRRAVAMSVGILCGIGRGTTTRAILALGQKDGDWSAQYKLCSRAPWEADGLFTCALKEALTHIPGDWCVLAFDDTRLKKTGKKIQGAQYHRDPLSPRFHANLMYGIRFLQASVMVPLHQTSERSARAIPVCFELAPCVKKPGKRAGPEAWSAYEKARSLQNLSVTFRNCLSRHRLRLDELGAERRLLLATVDGSFFNRKSMRELPERTALLVRARKDAKLCLGSDEPRRKYARQTFTPESVLNDPQIPFETDHFVFGGAERELKFKRVENVLWRSGTKTQKLTLLILAPTPYRVSPNANLNYRQAAFLICTTSGLCSRRLIQAYIDRWQIEVNHKDEKHILGVGQAQVWSTKAIPRQPALAVAAYSVLLLAALAAFGPGRSDAFSALPKWRKRQRRPSLQDLLTVFRAELADPNSALNQEVQAPKGFQNLVMTAAA